MKYDNTRWFSLNFEELNKLKAITVKGVETGVCQKETGSNQKETGSTQKETTIPETSSKTSSKTSYNKPTYNKPYKKLNNRSSHERQYDAKELEKKLLGEGEE